MLAGPAMAIQALFLRSGANEKETCSRPFASKEASVAAVG